MRGRGLPRAPRHLALYGVIAAVGTILPNSASYTAALHLPSGVMSIVISLVPMLAFPIAIAMATDLFSPTRLVGLLLGLGAILLIGLPEASLPDPGMVAWLPLALIAPAFYAFEGNYVARFGTQGLDPVQVLAGASVLGVLVTGPAAWFAGVFIDPRLPWDQAEGAIVGIGLAHALAYVGYVWLVGRAGAVFAAQVAYLVTGFGVLWALAALVRDLLRLDLGRTGADVCRPLSGATAPQSTVSDGSRPGNSIGTRDTGPHQSRRCPGRAMGVARCVVAIPLRRRCDRDTCGGRKTLCNPARSTGHLGRNQRLRFRG